MLSNFIKIHIYAYFGKYDIFFNEISKYIKENKNLWRVLLFAGDYESSFIMQCIVHGCRYNYIFAEKLYTEFPYYLPKCVKRGITDSYILAGKNLENDMSSPFNVLYPTKINLDKYPKNYYSIREAIVFYGRKDLIDNTFEDHLKEIYNSLYVKKIMDNEVIRFIRERIPPYYYPKYKANELTDNFFEEIDIDDEHYINYIYETNFEELICKYYLENTDSTPSTYYNYNNINFNTLDAIYFYNKGMYIDHCLNRFYNVGYLYKETYQIHRPTFSSKTHSNCAGFRKYMLAHYHVNENDDELIKEYGLVEFAYKCLYTENIKHTFDYNMYLF